MITPGGSDTVGVSAQIVPLLDSIYQLSYSQQLDEDERRSVLRSYSYLLSAWEDVSQREGNLARPTIEPAATPEAGKDQKGAPKK